MHTAILTTQYNFAPKINSMELSDRLNAVLKFYDVSVRKMSIKAGVHINTLQKIQNGSTAHISGDTVDKICNTYKDINKDWLRFGEGEMLIKPELANANDLLSYALLRIRDLEMILKLKEEKEKWLEEKLANQNKVSEQLATLEGIQRSQFIELAKDVDSIKRKLKQPEKKEKHVV